MFYISLTILFITAYYFATLGKTEMVRNTGLDIADSLPVILLPFLTLNNSVWIFIIGTIFANVLMRPSVFIGATAYLFVYGFAGIITALNYDFYLNYLIIAILFLTAPLVIVAFKIKKVLPVIGATIYAFLALVPLVYAFLVTQNFGFLALVIGDLTLIVYILGFKKEWYHFLSNSIFYTGVVLVPLTLQNLNF